MVGININMNDPNVRMRHMGLAKVRIIIIWEEIRLIDMDSFDLCLLFESLRYNNTITEDLMCDDILRLQQQILKLRLCGRDMFAGSHSCGIGGGNIGNGGGLQGKNRNRSGNPSMRLHTYFESHAQASSNSNSNAGGPPTKIEQQECEWIRW